MRGEEHLADPEWVDFHDTEEARTIHHPEPCQPLIAVGAFICAGCQASHVVLAIGTETVANEITVLPAVAREIAAAILASAERVDPQAVN